MDLKQELIDRLCVPENWDKYDYQTQRYSFDDVHEVLDDIVKKLTIPDVVGQSEHLKAEVFTLANKLALAGEGDAAIAMHRIHNRL